MGITAPEAKMKPRTGPPSAITAAALSACLIGAGHGQAQVHETHKLVNVGTHALYIECAGAGKPVVVFESGIGGSRKEWSHLQRQIQTRTRTCRYDRAGYGKSQRWAKPLNAQSAASALGKLLTGAREEGPYVIVAHSYGGFIARLAAAQNTIDIAGLVLLDTSHEDQFKVMEAKGTKPLAPTTGNPQIKLRWNEGMTGTHEGRKRVQAVLHARTSLWELQGFRESAIQVRDAPTVRSRLTNIVLWRTPLNSSARERDWTRMQESLAQVLGAKRSGMVRGAGHDIHLDRPRETEAAIVEVLEAVRAQMEGDKEIGQCGNRSEKRIRERPGHWQP